MQVRIQKPAKHLIWSILGKQFNGYLHLDRVLNTPLVYVQHDNVKSCLAYNLLSLHRMSRLPYFFNKRRVSDKRCTLTSVASFNLTPKVSGKYQEYYQIKP